jgi:UDP-2-acetamido-3-amino-2,3-dideoxy-glucuronate N-acetyltransferase
MPGDPFFVHESAVVEDGALIGRGAQVWHQAQVRSGARIGTETKLGKNVYVDAGVVIGARAKIQNNVSVYAGVTIDDDVFVGPSAVFTNDRVPRAFGEWSPAVTAVRRGVSIGANATIVCGVELGEFAMIAAGAVVVRSVSPHELVAGNPAGHLGWVCRCGRTTSRAEEQPGRLWCGTCTWDEQ